MEAKERDEPDTELGLRYELVNTRHGRFLANPNDTYIGRAMVDYGEFSELESQVLLQLLPAGGTAVEVGANIGAHTVALARKAGQSGRVYAFEPQPVIFQNLCANLALNGLTNVYPHNQACGSAASKMRFPDINYALKGNFGGVSLEMLPDVQTGMMIEIVPLDDLGLRRCDLLKIDAEGMEHPVIEGAENLIKSCSPILYVENDRPEKSVELIAQIQNLGYRAWWHTPPYFNKDNWANNAHNPWPGVVSVNMLCVHSSRKTNMTGLTEITSADDRPEKRRQKG
ncbi:MAG: FkbM family methyltransferase [Alphaproteobacteria bacterium]|nr:FkbM family methyltransferase [Alphaproteobacteria bacterium]